MTPYKLPFLNGATVEFPASMTNFGSMLDTMKTRYTINTITVYGLENWTNARKDALFSALAARQMQIVPRIEAYDPEMFAFRVEDAFSVRIKHSSFLEYLSSPSKKNTVAYIALNVPVDDGRIWPRVGGLNSPEWRAAQVTYTNALVKEIRNWVAADIPLYLSVFYGWDNSYILPSYKAAGADGYFINNYSYPLDYANPSDSTALDDMLINEDRLAQSMETFYMDYRTEDPLVIEYGFQTMTAHTKVPNQLAGLVKDKAAKRLALAATSRYYSQFDNVRGTMYFGYNIRKYEGNPPVEIDFALN